MPQPVAVQKRNKKLRDGLRFTFEEKRFEYLPANASFLRTLNVCKYLNLGPAAVNEMDYSFFLKIEEYIKAENLHRKRQEEKDKLKNKVKKRR